MAMKYMGQGSLSLNPIFSAGVLSQCQLVSVPRFSHTVAARYYYERKGREGICFATTTVRSLENTIQAGLFSFFPFLFVLSLLLLHYCFVEEVHHLLLIYHPACSICPPRLSSFYFHTICPTSHLQYRVMLEVLMAV